MNIKILNFFSIYTSKYIYGGGDEMKKIATLIISGILVLSLIGCSVQEAPKVENPPKQEAPEVKPEEKLSETKEVDIQIEGTVEKMTLRLLNSKELSFYTYYPEDMVVDSISSAEGKGYFIYSNFQGNKNENVYVEIIVLPEDVKTQEEAARIITEGREAVGFDLIEGNEATSYNWALETFRFQKGDFMAVGYLTKHNNQYLLITRQYPPEYADGMAPRFTQIVNEFTWTDTNSKLNQ